MLTPVLYLDKTHLREVANDLSLMDIYKWIQGTWKELKLITKYDGDEPKTYIVDDDGKPALAVLFMENEIQFRSAVNGTFIGVVSQHDWNTEWEKQINMIEDWVGHAAQNEFLCNGGCKRWLPYHAAIFVKEISQRKFVIEKCHDCAGG